MSVLATLPTMGTLFAAESAEATAFPAVLPALILIPAIGALILALVPGGRNEIMKPLALVFSVAAAAVSIFMLMKFNSAAPTVVDGFDPNFLAKEDWISQWGISWHSGIDGISLWLVILTTLLFPLAIMAVNPGHDDKAYYAWILILEAGCIGVFVSLDLFMFFIFFEVVLVPMYFLIAKWGHGNREYAAMKFFLYTMFGSALMLVGLISAAFLHRNATGGELTFDLLQIAESQSISQGAARWIFLSFALAFAVKVPIFPLHTWLPDAHTEAPTAGSVILAGVMLKLGTYGFIRFGLYLFPEAARFFAPVFLTLGVIGIIYGAVVATMQKDLKRVVAYSSVAHLGFIVLGIFSMNTLGIEGGILQMVNHGVSTGALFLLVGWIYERRHTRMIAELGGLQKSAPMLAGVFTLVMLSSIGLPGLNGFVGEFLALLGAFSAYRWWGIVAAVGVIFAALYLLWAYQRVFHGEAEGDNATMRDLNLTEGLIMVPFIIAIVFMGIYPKPVIERMEPAVEALVAHIEVHDGAAERIVTEDLGGSGFDGKIPFNGGEGYGDHGDHGDDHDDHGDDHGDHGDHDDHGDDHGDDDDHSEGGE